MSSEQVPLLERGSYDRGRWEEEEVREKWGGQERGRERREGEGKASRGGVAREEEDGKDNVEIH